MTTPKRKYTRLTPSQWAEITAYWESGDHTLAELTERYGVSQRAIQTRLSKCGAKKGAKAAEMAAAVKAEVFKEEIGDESTLITRAREVQESVYADATVIQDLMRAQLELAQKSPAEAFKAATTLKALSLAAATLERLHATKLRALGLDNGNPSPDELPVLVIRDLSKEEIAAMQEPAEEDEDDALASPAPGATEDADDEIIVEGADPDGDIVVEGEPTKEEEARNSDAIAREIAIHGGRLVKA